MTAKVLYATLHPSSGVMLDFTAPLPAGVAESMTPTIVQAFETAICEKYPDPAVRPVLRNLIINIKIP